MIDLIIPDVHNRVGVVQHILTREKYDRVTFLGDYFDDFGDFPHDAENTAKYVRRWLHHPNTKLLLGNHDAAYYAGPKWHGCSGWTPEKHAAINRILKPCHWKRMRLWVKRQGWLLSHAGFNKTNYIHGNRLNAVHGTLLATLALPQNDQISILSRIKHTTSVGLCRGGWSEKGGVLWQDWEYEFEPILGVRQIVGHTPGKQPRSIIRDDYWQDWCIDTHSRHYGLIIDGKFEVRQV